MTTALEEVLGGSAVLTVAGAKGLRAEKRLWFLTTAGAGNSAKMPPARVGNAVVLAGRVGAHWTLIVDTAAASTIALKTASGSAIATLAAGEVWEVLLLDTGTADGTWRARRVATTYAEGTSKPANRLLWTVALNQNSSQPFNLYDHLRNVEGWDGVDPAAVLLTIRAGWWRGSNTTTKPAIDTGRPGVGAYASLPSAGWPSGSFLMMIVEQNAILTGKGGNGGRGADMTGIGGLLAVNGSPGGDALILRMNHVISNYGFIQGGGGGGAGGPATSTTAGGGGGGGTGLEGGLGGGAGQGGTVGAGAGAGGNGTIQGGGAAGNNGGGTTFAGAGGAPGTAGSNTSAASGGAAGRYAVRETAYVAAFNFAVGGTVYGATGTI